MLITQDKWHCGSEGVTRNISYNIVKKDCPTLAAALNHCCAAHDDCYGRQAGQQTCDEQFCECNRRVTRIPTEEGYKCKAFMNDGCKVLGIIGFIAYGDSDYTDPTKPANNEVLFPTTMPDVGFLSLYEKCPFSNITLASCSQNFDLCMEVHSIDFCTNDLCHCIMDASETDPTHNKTCLPAVAHTCRAVLNYSSEVLSYREIRKQCTIATLFLLAVVAIVVTIFYMYGKSNREQRKTMDEGKYLQIHTVESARSVNPLLTNTD